jgi:glycosyltransferase involved in cell wall biosynthesis
MMAHKHVLVDSRWDGDTGIGRMYREIINRIPPGLQMSEVRQPMSLGNLLSPLMLAREISRSTADVFYSPSFMPPLYAKIPFVFTIHDLMHLFYYSRLHAIYYKQVIARCAAGAKSIITVSDFSKGQLVNLLGIKEELIQVVYNGISTSFFTNNETSSTARPYFLYVGNRRTNKNLPAMLRAFALANIPHEFEFALSGNPDAAIQQLLIELKIEKRVRFLGFISESDLPKIYKGAYATLFVSLMEGFGLPVLESMASGTPVLTSSESSLPEIAGDAALCVDPQSVEAIRSGIEKLVSNSTFYTELQSKGIRRASEFSWESSARKTWEIILKT